MKSRVAYGYTRFIDDGSLGGCAVRFLSGQAGPQSQNPDPSACVCWVGHRASEGRRVPAGARRSGIEVMRWRSGISVQHPQPFRVLRRETVVQQLWGMYFEGEAGARALFKDLIRNVIGLHRAHDA